MARLFPSNNFVRPQLPNPDKDLNRLLIGEAPGQEESQAEQPFVGGSGRVLNNLLRSAGVAREGLTITNCLSCRPPDNVFPSDREARSYISKDDAEKAIKQCYNNHVRPLIKSRKWNRIDLVGDKALRIVGGKFGGISKWRGSPLDIPETSSKGIAIMHPSYLMRDQTMLPVAANDLTKSLDEPPEHYKPFPSIEDVRAFKATTFAFDLEEPKYRTMGRHAPIEMVGLCATATEALCVPTRGEYLSELKRIFRNAVAVIGHNCLQYDLPELQEKLDIKINSECQVWDTMLLQHLVCPDLPHDLEFVASQFLSKPAWKDDKTQGWEPYCCRDTDASYQVWQELLPMVEREGLGQLYRQVQVPLAKICLLMHQTGFKVNPNRIGEVREKLLKEQDELETRLPDFLRGRDIPIKKRTLAPPGTLGKSGKPVKYVLRDDTERVIPWRSPTEKQRFLYSNDPGCLGLEPIIDAKKGNITTGHAALERIYSKTGNEAVKALRTLNKMDELLSTFLKIEEGKAQVTEVHASFNVHGTSTGRLSSSDPNLQNIPGSIRHIYVPHHADWVIWEMDFSGIENRLQSYFAGDTERTKRLSIPGFSEHKYLASKISGIPIEKIEKSSDPDSVYSKAKHVVHGVDRGLGPKKASKMYGIPLKECHTLFDTWKSEIKNTILWQQKLTDQAKRDGFLVNPFGRRQWYWTSDTYTKSLSFPPQATGADVLYRVMIALLYERIGWPEELVKKVVGVYHPLPKPSNILICVHDSLVGESPKSQVEEVMEIVSKVATQPWPELGGMTLPIEIKCGPSWGECE